MSSQGRARVAHVASHRDADTIPATPFGMNRIESTRSAPNTGWTRPRATMAAMSGHSAPDRCHATEHRAHQKEDREPVREALGRDEVVTKGRWFKSNPCNHKR